MWALVRPAGPAACLLLASAAVCSSCGHGEGRIPVLDLTVSLLHSSDTEVTADVC